MGAGTGVKEAGQLVVRPITGYTGAEISGINLSEPIDDRTYLAVREALNKYGVIFFRNQDLTPQEYVAFGSRFGSVSVSKNMPTLPGHPLINLLVREPDDHEITGEAWHTDQAFREFPTFGTILYAREVPAYGADTSYINTSPVYETLSSGLKQMLESLRAVHAVAHMQKAQNHGAEKIILDQSSAVHPVVISHPETSRKTLYVNPGFTERFDGWTEQESAPLLNYLYQHALKPEFGCRFHWEKNSIAFWDNRQVWHYANNDRKGIRRVMHRLVLESY